MYKRIFSFLIAAALLMALVFTGWAEGAVGTAVTRSSLKLRQEPNTSAKVLDTYKKGTEVVLLEAGEAWCHVQIGKRTGYMMTEYLEITLNAPAPSTEPASPPPSPGNTDTPGEESAAAPLPTSPVIPDCLCDPSVLLEEAEETVVTSTSYQSQNVFINITATRTCNADVYVADIHLRSLDSLQRGLANKWKNGTLKIDKIAQAHQAILAMTSDSAENLDMGWVIMNGQTLRKTRNRKRDLCLLLKTGEMRVIPAAELDHEEVAALAEQGAIWQTFLFGPTLLDSEGKRMTQFNSTVGIKNPRSVIGYYEPGHYCFVQVDGRNTQSQLEPGKKNRGMTLTELSQFMEELGCQAAYNLDGGQSSVMYFNGSLHSTPQSGGRRLGDAVLIAEP